MKNYDYMDNIKAAIGVKDLDGTTRVITVDEKGYPGYTGALLVAKYQKIEKIERLIDLGDLVRLGEEVEPCPNHPHYITINGGKKRSRLQERVTISKYRDIRVNENGILKKQKKSKYETYKTEIEIYWGTGAEYVYIYNLKTKCWETFGIGNQIRRFTDLKINYKVYVDNLVDGEDIDDLTVEEKKNLARYKFSKK